VAVEVPTVREGRRMRGPFKGIPPRLKSLVQRWFSDTLSCSVPTPRKPNPSISPYESGTKAVTLTVFGRPDNPAATQGLRLPRDGSTAGSARHRT
jgi:hypothetical protein